MTLTTLRSRPGRSLAFALLVGTIIVYSSLPVAAQTPAGGSQASDDEPCINYFFGVGIPQSYEKAFACFQKGDHGTPSYIWLILMTLNGDGAPKSVKKARELLTEAQKRSWPEPSGELASMVSGDCCDSDWIEAAADVVAEHEKDPEGGNKVNICDFTHGPRMDWSICVSELEDVWEARYEAEMAPIQAKLSASVKASFDQIKAMFRQLQAADAAWAMAETYNPGQDGPYVQARQQIFDESHFASLVKKVVRDHGLKRHTAQEFQAKDAALNGAYHKRIGEIAGGWEEQLKDPDFKEHWAELREKKADFLEAARKAQRIWIRLQEPWKTFCEELYRGEMPPEEIDRAIETELREIRTVEIADDPNYDPMATEMP
jgi:hypothetical protein